MAEVMVTGDTHHTIDSSGAVGASQLRPSLLRMFVKICSVSRLHFLRRFSVATLTQMSNPSAAPGPVESSIFDKVSVYNPHSLRPVPSDNPASSPTSSDRRGS